MKAPAQIVGNSSPSFACYQLSQRSWNVMPKARNAKGIDIIAYSAYSADATSFLGLQVKALNNRAPVPAGMSQDKVIGDFWIIINQLSTTPNAYIMKPHEVRMRARCGETEGRSSFWLPPSKYAIDQFKSAWDRIAIPQPSIPDHHARETFSDLPRCLSRAIAG